MGYCDGHYQRLYLMKDLKVNKPVKVYCERGAGLKLLKRLAKGKTDHCVIWPYGKDSKGYGAIYYKGKRLKAHRAAKILMDNINEPPKEVFACHKCDNSLCVNPRHIYWGDAKTNIDDKYIFRT